MTLCLAKYSALESLAAAAQPAHGLLALPRTEPFDYDVPSSKAVADAQRSLPFLTQPATFVLPDASYRRNLRGASFLICKHAAVPGALWNLRAPADKPRQRNRNPIPAASEAVQGLPGTSSPAFCLAQLGTELPFAQLAELACSLTGLYRFAPSRTGSILDAVPIATLSEMRGFLERHSSIAGSRNARRALGHAIERLGSPAETALYLMLCLPRRMGGFGFPHPVANGTITPSSSRRTRVSQSEFHPDLLWPKARLILEYDSDEHHRLPQQAARDAKRRNDLEILGFDVIVATRVILRNVSLFDKMADQIRLRLGLRATIRTEKWLQQRTELRQLLLSPSPNSHYWR